MINASEVLDPRFYLVSIFFLSGETSQDLILCHHQLSGKNSITICLRACSHEPWTVNYPGVMIAEGQALPRVHMMICCPRVNFIAPGQVYRHLITTNLSEFL